jgi:hypothetical protein
MINRRDALQLLSFASAGAWVTARQICLNGSIAQSAFAAKPDFIPPLAPGLPSSSERMALIESFEKR